MNILEIVCYTFAGVVSIQVMFYLFVFGKFAFSKEKKQTKENVPVSVIICAKNEGTNLRAFLPYILNQDYANYQTVLINDASIDDTLEVMEDFANTNDSIKIVNVKNNEAFWANKKYALTLGIKAAKHNILLFTDADCKPVSKHWISDMVSHFNNNKSIVLGYGAYSKVKNSILNKLVRFETLLTATQYMAFAKLGIPYMGVGRNLAYTKDAFFKANGFMGHMHIRSGDDDLFVNQVGNSKNTAICVTKESFTTSNPKTTFASWIKQKRRHITAANHYKKAHKFLLGLFYISQLLFWILSITLIVSQSFINVVVALISLRFIAQFLSIGFSAKKLNEQDLIFLLPILELFLIGSQLTIFIINLFSKPTHWK